MPKVKTKRVVATPGFVQYLRTSDEDAQAPERSHAAQRRDIKTRLMHFHNLPELGEYVDNFTGTSADRKNYQQMLADARNGKFSHIFASVPDRFGRDDVEALRAIDEMTRLGIIVRFASHPDLDPADADDRLYLNILFGMAKRESAVISQRCRGGMLSKLLSGGWSWKAPDGYLNKEIRINQLGPEEQLRHAQYKRWVEIDPEQAKVWRTAWDLLLTDDYTLEEICEELHKRGYRLAKGRPFVAVKRYRGKEDKPHGMRIFQIQLLSKAFHNWFYAGWVVAQNEWANIAPKTIRGEWEPVVSTEEFERGLAILARRRKVPMPVKKHFYLLQGLVYIELYFGKIQKLTCGKPNANRARGGVSYYCIPRSNQNFLCHEIDAQLDAHIRAVQVNPEFLPAIRAAYLADVSHFVKDSAHELKVLETRIRKLDEKELNLWRAFTDHGMNGTFYEALARENQDERERLESMMTSLEVENRNHVTDLDAALNIIAQIGDRFSKCTPEQQRAILLQMVERVIINRAGRIKIIEWKPPFCYLIPITEAVGKKRQSRGKKQKDATTIASFAGSFQLTWLGRKGIRTPDLYSAIVALSQLSYTP